MMICPRNSTASLPRGAAREWIQRVLNLLFPPHCVVCSQLGAWFCAECMAEVRAVPQPICVRCGEPVRRAGHCSRCQATPVQLDGIRAVALHQGVLRTAIHAYKYERRRVLAPILGEMMHVFWERSGVPVDVIVPVPLHSARKRERGFDQARLLALHIAERAQLRLDDAHLHRTRSTVPQVGLGADQRRANVANAFSWRGDKGEARERRVLLIDDVCTTGATLEACANVLRGVGAASIWALTLARPLDAI